MAKRNVSASIVRAWAADNLDSISDEGHLCIKGSNGTPRGRLHPKVVEAFNRSHKSQKYAPGTPAEGSLIRQTVVTVSKSGRKVPRTVTMTAAEVRTLTGTESKRGRIPTALKVAAAEAKVAAAV